MPDLDEETLADTLEGMTTLHELLAGLIRSALTEEALAEGLKARIGRDEGPAGAAAGARRPQAGSRARRP